MRRFTKYNHYEDSELMRMADDSTDDLTIELCNRLDEWEPDHDGCFNEDDVDEARSEGRESAADDIRGDAKSLLEEVKSLLQGGGEFVRDDVVKKINDFVEGI